MIAAVLIFAVTSVAMILAVLLYPKLRLGRLSLDSYVAVTLLGAAAMLALGACDIRTVGAALLSDSAVNPLKILVLFIAMTVLSVFLDEVGFFRYLAAGVLRRAHGGQRRLFLLLYVTVSVLTVFTSNDIVVLSFTPFICYFAKNAGIDPMPYLAAEFVAANTWSMMLIIGNPTNIYLATAAGIDFVSYLRVMLLPTVLSGTVAFLVLYRLYHKRLAVRMATEPERAPLPDRPLLTLGLFHLLVATVLLAVGAYIGLAMWAVALGAAVSLFVLVLILSAVRRRAPRELLSCLVRAPWQLVPFVLSMFVMIVVLSEVGVTARLAALLDPLPPTLSYGLASFLSSNLVNNIPMSVLFSEILTAGGAPVGAVYATVIGSNVGAFFTPIGALAGIMWSEILRSHGLAFGYRDFLKLGLTAAVPALLSALFGLFLVLA